MITIATFGLDIAHPGPVLGKAAAPASKPVSPSVVSVAQSESESSSRAEGSKRSRFTEKMVESVLLV